VTPRAGAIEFDGRPTRGLRMDELSRAGLLRTFQNLEVFGSMTVLENVLVRLEATAAARPLPHAARLDKCRGVLRELGLPDPDIEVSSLAYPQRKLVEFARAMVADARLLLLDEPTAGLAAQERQRVVNLVTSQMRARGISGVLVEHDMSVVRRMCDVVYVMDAGSCIAQGTFDEISHDPRVREAYLGPYAAEDETT
jgi:branched-chain amino acid transport system ATP-binding protein